MYVTFNSPPLSETLSSSINKTIRINMTPRQWQIEYSNDFITPIELWPRY